MIIIENWQGLISNVSPYGIPPGAGVSQINFQCLRPGELTTRNGQTTVTFTTHTGATTAPIAMVRHQLGTQECVVYQNAAGHIFVGRGVQ